MHEFFREPCRTVYRHAAVVVSAVFCLSAAPTITQVTPNVNPVPKYEKLELTVGLTAAYANPYDPNQIALSAVFTSPTSKIWTINGFYNGSQWKIRFAASETGAWSYVVKATDSTGSTQSAAGSFSCTASANHGWIKVAPNNRYLCYDDGTSFYGVGMAYCWSVTTSGLSTLQSSQCNTWVYWNGTYGGYNLIESPASGIGKYDQTACSMIDSMLTWSEARGLKMILVLWPHDYLAQTMTGSWPNKWSLNAYQSIVSCKNFYSDSTSWSYQAKQYRYDIARWGYHTALLSWQLIDEISGTDGYVSNQASANAWMTKFAGYFHTNDPFNHPTESSLGGYWPHGDSVNTMSNTENYSSYTAPFWAGLTDSLWNAYDKPAISGEAAGSSISTGLWSPLANGMAMNPMFWQFNQGLDNTADLANFPPFANFVASINFAGLTSLKRANVTVTGQTAYGMTSDQLTFGWITGTISGKSLSVTGLANGSYTLQWWDCTAGTKLSTGTVSVTAGSLTAVVPTTTETAMAFQIISPTAVIAHGSPATGNVRPILSCVHGSLRLLEPLAGGGVIKIMTIQGRTVAKYRVAGSNITAIPAGRMQSGVYFAEIVSGNKRFRQKIQVTD